LLIFGSCLNGLFDNKESDLDLTIITATENHHSTLAKCRKELDKHPNHYSKEKKLFWMKAGCQLELTMTFRGRQIKVDLLVNKYLEVLNSQLIGTYCKLDRRYMEAALCLKRIFKSMDPENKNNRLNSFSVYLLLLAFMIRDNYLPNLL
jgi:DNA polymerase sigma